MNPLCVKKIPALRTLCALCVLCVLSFSILGAQEVDRDELNQGLPGNINFFSYEGPHAVIDSRAQILSIGTGLGSLVNLGLAEAGGQTRYFVIHSVSDGEPGRLNADIFGLGVDTGVDHIRNLRSIIQGYLQAAYGYSADDAALLAEFITIYNAVFRGNWDYFSSRYKLPVLNRLTPGQAGLSIRYDEWPGRTLILIPLGREGLSSVDTSAITSAEVIDQMRSEEGMGIDQRQDMVDLKEREADAAAEQAAMEREDIAREAQNVAGEREEAAQERQDLERDREQLQADEAAGNLTPDEAAQQAAALDEREQALEQQEAALDQREETLTDRREAADETEAFAEQKAEEARQDRQEIAGDQQTIIAGGSPQTAAPPAAASGVLGARLADSQNQLGSIVRLDSSTGQETRRSALNTVNVRTITLVGGRLFAVAGSNQGANQAIRLVEINSQTLEMTNQGAVDIHPQSMIWVSGNNLYAITVSGGSYYLARFNTDLERQAQSTVAVHPWASVLIQGSMIISQRADGSALVLDMTNLTEALRN